MAEDLQQLLEKIQRDGVDKAQAEADAIRKRALTEKDALLKDAKTQADALRAQAEKDAAAFTERAQTTVRQAARDTILEVQEAVTKLLTALLARNVDAALADPAAAAALALEAVKTLDAPAADVAANARLAEALRAQLATQAAHGVTVVTDDTLGTGFSVRLDAGRVEHDFTAAAVTAALTKRLRPALAELVKA